MLLPFAYSFWLPNTPAICITFAGAAFGAWIFQEGLRKYRTNLPPETVASAANLAKDNQELKKEVKRLQSMQLNVTDIQSMLAVSLLEINTRYQDFKQSVVSDTLNESIFGDSRTITEYLGYFNENIKVRYGIDLNKIRIREEGAKIVVSGIKCEFQGIREQDTVDEHYEIREKKVSLDGNTTHSHKVVQGDRDCLLLKAHKAHISELRDKLNTGVDLTDLEGASTFVERLGEEFVKNFFFPTGKQIEFAEDGENAGYSLEQFVTRHNLQIEKERLKLLETMKPNGY